MAFVRLPIGNIHEETVHTCVASPPVRAATTEYEEDRKRAIGVVSMTNGFASANMTSLGSKKSVSCAPSR